MGEDGQPRNVVRQLRPGDWRLLRDLRLRALADSPGAFAAEVEEARSFPDDEWRRRAKGWRAVGDVVFVCGTDALVVGVRDREDAWLGGMWVAPERRRGGIGVALAYAVVSWARSWGAKRVFLSVADGNRPAAALYERLGFVKTGSREQLREDLVEVEYALELQDERP